MKKIKTFLLALLMVFINVITVACSGAQVTPEFVFFTDASVLGEAI